ncbi:MAG TPA: hypothetical protein VGH88_18795 [Streptosporangiaceae bacterium]|jgi:hypothetical protein
MTSLAFSHPAVPTSLGYGFCEVRTSGEQLIVDQADPRILVTRELLARALREGTHPAVTITEGRIVINGVNRRVVYEIGRRLAAIDCYEAAWPEYGRRAGDLRGGSALAA